jgi:hypothetical protein
MRAFRLLSLLLTVTAGCKHWTSFDRSTLPAASDYPHAKAVVLDDELEVRFHATLTDPLVEETVQRRVLILRDGGQAAASLMIPYDPHFSSVREFAARFIAPDGSERTFARSDLIDVPLIRSFVLYDSARGMTLGTPTLPAGTVLEYRYTRVTHDLRMIHFRHAFDRSVPVRHSRLTAIAPGGWKVAWAAVRHNQSFDFPPAVSVQGGLTRMTWEQRELPALPDEPFGAEADALRTSVGVRLVRWTVGSRPAEGPTDAVALSAWLYALSKAPFGGERPRELARDLVSDLPDDPELRARRLYNWVRDHIAYCAVSIGIGGLRPHASGDVERHQYGDCKDKANLLHDMLAAVDIDSHMVVLYAHDGLPLVFEPVDWMTNHAILEIVLPRGPLLVDPTARTTPFGALPVSDQEAECLPVAHRGGALRRAPASRAEDNESRLELDLVPEGDALTGRFHATLTGHRADQLRGALLEQSHEEQLAALGKLLELPSQRLKEWTVEDGGAPDLPKPVKAKGQLSLPHAWRPSPLQLVRLSDLVGSAVPALPRVERHGPLVFPGRQRRQDVVRLTVDDAAEIALPEPVELSRPFGRYELRWTREPGQLVASRTLVLTEHVFSAAQYGEVKQFFDEALAAETRLVTIRRSPR